MNRIYLFFDGNNLTTLRYEGCEWIRTISFSSSSSSQLTKSTKPYRLAIFATLGPNLFTLSHSLNRSTKNHDRLLLHVSILSFPAKKHRNSYSCYYYLMKYKRNVFYSLMFIYIYLQTFYLLKLSLHWNHSRNSPDSMAIDSAKLASEWKLIPISIFGKFHYGLSYVFHKGIVV